MRGFCDAPHRTCDNRRGPVKCVEKKTEIVKVKVVWSIFHVTILCGSWSKYACHYQTSFLIFMFRCPFNHLRYLENDIDVVFVLGWWERCGLGGWHMCAIMALQRVKTNTSRKDGMREQSTVFFRRILLTGKRRRSSLLVFT